MTAGAGAGPPHRAPFLARPGVLIAVAVVVGLVVVAVLFLTGAFGGGDRASSSGSAREVSVQELREVAESKSGAVYWAGDLPGRRLELSQTGEGNVFVRYLTGDAVVGDGRPAFTTVGTYPAEGAYAEVRKRSRGRDMENKPAPGGGLATWSKQRPSSVYVGYPGSDLLVEVYDPDPQRARTLALSGDVGPIR